MTANLTLLYSSKVYLNLIENMELEEIDNLTTNYKDQEEILKLERFVDQVQAFYIYTSNYCRKIKNPKDRKGKLCITYFNSQGNFQALRVIYKEDKIKQDPKKMVNSINRELKAANNCQLVLALLNTFNTIFESDYNRIYHKLSKLKYSLKYTTVPTKQQMPIYNKLLKIIKDELNKGYDPTTGKTSSTSYYHIRIVDEFLEESQGIKTLPNKKKNQPTPTIEPANLETNPQKSLVKTNISSYKIGESWKS